MRKWLLAPMLFLSLLGCEDSEETCNYGGKSYAAGQSFPASDGCNTCQCNDTGSVSCTESACVVDAGAVDAAVIDAAIPRDGCGPRRCGEPLDAAVDAAP